MSRRGPRKLRPPLDEANLQELALAYVARFATSRSKLSAYLFRKVRERGWDGGDEPPIPAIVEKAARAGYVDDSAFALAKARSLTARGYGERRVAQALHLAGIDEADGAEARDLARAEAVQAAVHFARRRRLGPFASEMGDPKARERALAAMVRAGHEFALAKAILALPPGAEVDSAAFEFGR